MLSEQSFSHISHLHSQLPHSYKLVYVPDMMTQAMIPKHLYLEALTLT